MNSVLLDNWRSLKRSEREWHDQKDKESLDSEIMSQVHFLEDHGDAVERSGYSEEVSKAMDEAYSGTRSRSLLAKFRLLRKEVEKEILVGEGN